MAKKLNRAHLVVTPDPAHTVSGPVSPGLRRANQPVISTRNMFSTPRPSFLARLTHAL
jgi:hypothetical protein